MSLLSIQNLNAFYGDFQALFGIDFNLEERETIAVIPENAKLQLAVEIRSFQDSRQGKVSLAVLSVRPFSISTKRCLKQAQQLFASAAHLIC